MLYIREMEIAKTIDLVKPLIAGSRLHTIILTLDRGDNDIWFGSDESPNKPELIVTAEEPGIPSP